MDWNRRRRLGVISGLLLPMVVTGALTAVDQPSELRPAAWYLLAVVVASLIGGVSAVATAIAVSAGGLWYSVGTPPHSFGQLSEAEWWGTLGFVVVAGAIGLLVTRLESAVRERDTAVEARLRTEAEARTQRELDTTRAELFVSELQRTRDRRNVDALQDAMVPSDLPEVPGFELSACFTPASPDLAVGGDWYDAFLVGPDTLALAVGDVSGHGVRAAALMAQLRNALRAYAFEDPHPTEVLGRLNRFLCRLEAEQFATAVYASVRLTDARCVWSTAGHPPPLAFGPSGTGPAQASGPPAPLLGYRPDAAFGSTEMPLRPGEGVLLYTDGLVERRGEHIDEGTERLRALLATKHADPVAGLCDQMVAELTDGQEGRDDVCQLLVRRAAGAPGHTPRGGGV